ncbi:MAG: tRNA (N(6)-L-threonylcarbamoyladenosine(37)-C(2))-methylthiotransferase, partial [archaeon]|nr:tRNA (N(6)-L-threonylcarbamoyladenosine(37)-C(2))-methylthiotransferase [archaeon]
MDIEDLGKLEFPSNNKEIHLKNRRYHAMPNLDENDECYHKNIPGTQKVHIKTYGCSHNISDSEYMMGLLYDYGYDIVDSIEASDIVIINSCTVKGPSQDAFITYITKSKKLGKAVVVCGCVPQADKNLKGMEECSMLGLTQIDRIIEVVEETLKGNIVSLLQKKDLPSLDLPKIRKNSLIEIVPINMGCLGSCTYCKTKHARGKLISYEPEAIVKACENAWNNGAKEIWITSEDTAVYGRDIGTDLPSLMIKILKDIPKDVMIRIGMANPPYIMEHLDKMVKVLKHPNVYSFIHIPVQAGSNEVLDKMIREYNIEDFSYVCDYFLKKIPEITIATDIICGFPTETKENFEETLDLIKKYKFPVINISQFYPRPGTVAAKMKKVESQEVKRRSTAVANLFKSYENYYHLADTEQLVWFHNIKDEDKNKEQNLMVGHNKSYVKVLVKKDDSLLGKVAKVKVTGINKWHIYGEVIDRNPSLEKVEWETYFRGMIDNDFRPT